MTPAIDAARKANVAYHVHEYDHDLSSGPYGREAAEKLAVPESQVFKTLVASLNSGELVVGVIPVSTMLSMKRIARAAGARKAAMAVPADVERATGYVLGGVSPLGQKKTLRTFIDSSAQDHSTIYVSAGRRGVEIEMDPQNVKSLTNGVFADLCQ